MVKDGTTLRREAGGGTAVVDVIDAERRLAPAAATWLAARAGHAARSLGATGEARVRVVGDAAMSAAHERYRGVTGTTDVLTFDLSEGPHPPAGAARTLDADILVCVDEAARQASARGHALERELLLYVVHGLLHCLGYDDHDEVSAAAMHAREDEVLEAIGVGATFDPGRAGARP